MNRNLTIIFLISIIASCTKDQPPEIQEADSSEFTCLVNFGGEYECELHSFSTFQGSTHSDTTFTDTLLITHQDELVKVHSWEMSQDSVCSKQLYGQAKIGPTWFWIRFYGNNLYYQYRFGSLSSYSIYTYHGRKI